MVKTTTKISTHDLNLIHDGNERCCYSEEEDGADVEEGWEV